MFLQRFPITYVLRTVQGLHGCGLVRTGWQPVNRLDRILSFPIPCNALCLPPPPKFCINYCCEILLGICRPPKTNTLEEYFTTIVYAKSGG